jgi:hypothetical protein
MMMSMTLPSVFRRAMGRYAFGTVVILPEFA